MNYMYIFNCENSHKIAVTTKKNKTVCGREIIFNADHHVLVKVPIAMRK